MNAWGPGSRALVRRLQQSFQHNTTRMQQRSRWKSTNTASQSPVNAAQLKQRSIPGPSWAWIEPFTNSSPVRTYNAMQKRSPLLTQFESALVIYFIGDLSAQLVGTTAFADGEYEPIRGVRAMIIGGISSIPSYKWFVFLGRNFNYSTSHWVNIAIKIGINQTFFTPIFNTYFFGMQSFLSGNSWEVTRRRLIETVPVSWKNSWKVWPAVTAFSFTYIQPQNRSVFAGFVAVFWQTYLSWLNKNAEQKEHGGAQMSPTKILS